MAIKGMIKLMNKGLYSYPYGRERTNATAIPPLSPPSVKTFCHWRGILTLKILKNVIPP